MRKSLQPKELGDLLTQARVAILATQLTDGSMLLAPVWHEWTAGGFTILIDGNDAKMRNIRRNPSVSVVVGEDDPHYRGIEVRGEVKFFDSPPGPVLRRLAERYLAGRDFEAYLARMSDWANGAKVIRVEPGVLRAWDFADEDWN